MSALQLPLYYIFQRLRAEGMSLGIRDYLEALRALSLYPEPFYSLSDVAPSREHEVVNKHASSVNNYDRVTIYCDRKNRDQLVWLCQTLWARTADERQLVYQVVTGDIPKPKSFFTYLLKQCLESSGGGQVANYPLENNAITTDPPAFSPYVSKSVDNNQTSNDTDIANNRPPNTDSKTVQSNMSTVSVETVDDDGDLTLPQLPVQMRGGHDLFSFHEDPIISPLWLQSIWRRLFIPSKRPDQHHIDVEATVISTAKSGKLTTPVMQARVINRARLLVLIDSSDAMQPWKEFERVLVHSLDSRRSRIEQVSVAYFHSVPGTYVYKTRSLHEPIPLQELLRNHRATPLLIFGEAAAVSRRPIKRMIARMRAFLRDLQAREVRPLVWINPMHPARWKGTYMDELKQVAQAHAVELNEESLLRAIDILRGQL